MNEDHTAAVLKGIPIFCVNRIYKIQKGPTSFTKVQYYFEFDNEYSVSIVEFTDRKFSSGHQYEMLVNVPGKGGNPVLRGDAKYMNILLTNVERITGDSINSIDNDI